MTHRLITFLCRRKHRCEHRGRPRALWLTALIGLLLTAAAPAFADAHYTTEIVWNGEAMLEGWVSGTNGRFAVKASTDPSFPYGSIIYTQDGGNTAYLYSPDSSECIKTSGDQLVQFKRSQIKQMRVTADGLNVEHFADEPGPDMFGFKTRHSRVKVSVTIHVPTGSVVQTYQLVVAQDYWAASDIPEHAPDLALFTASTSGIPLLDDAVAAELAKTPGFPLKRLVAVTSVARGESDDMGQNAIKIMDFATGPVDQSLFDLPKSCQ